MTQYDCHSYKLLHSSIIVNNLPTVATLIQFKPPKFLKVYKGQNFLSQSVCCLLFVVCCLLFVEVDGCVINTVYLIHYICLVYLLICRISVYKITSLLLYLHVLTLLWLHLVCGYYCPVLLMCLSP